VQNRLEQERMAVGSRSLGEGHLTQGCSSTMEGTGNTHIYTAGVGEGLG